MIIFLIMDWPSRKSPNPAAKKLFVKKPPKLPVILAYTKFYESSSIFNPNVVKALKQCPFKCDYSEDKR